MIAFGATSVPEQRQVCPSGVKNRRTATFE